MIENFGTLPDGQTVQRIKLQGGRLTASVITYGASLQDLRLVPHQHSLVLGFPNIRGYLEYSYFGAMVGRVANRIANARFLLDGRPITLDKNEKKIQTLHGGKHAISARNWQIVSSDQTSVTLTINDKERDTGFPGNCEIVSCYSLVDDTTLRIETSATSDQNTVCNIAHHSYFNLSAGPSILGHELEIGADNYLPVDSNLIPTGVVQSVENNGFDFREAKPLIKEVAQTLDHNFCLNSKQETATKIPVHAAALYAPQSGISMRISTTQPGLQVYAGAGLDTKLPGHAGLPYKAFAGMALEPQHWPDAPNHPHFPDITLRKGDIYQEISTFSFADHAP